MHADDKEEIENQKHNKENVTKEIPLNKNFKRTLHRG